MYSLFIILSASFILYLLSIIQISEAWSTLCINFPRNPVHGSLKIHGKFILRLKCTSQDMDLPLDASGDSGILFCDPNDRMNGYISNVKAPKCQTLVRPSLLFMPIRLTYTAETCDGSFMNDVTRKITTLRDSNLQSFNPSCGKGLQCSWSDVEVQCDANTNFKNSIMPKQFAVSFTIDAQYKSDLSVDGYLKLLETIRNTGFATDRGLAATTQLWSVKGTILKQAYVGAWTASCTEYQYALGTNLAIHRIASCRGCSATTVFDPARKMCVLCPYNHYSPRPFAKKCQQCPPESEWDDRDKWINLCYSRA